MTRDGTPPREAAPGGLPLQEVLGLLPELRLLVPLREGLLSASQVDAASTWQRERRYATFDGRVLAGDGIERIVRSVARREADVLATLVRGVGEALAARAGGRRREAVEVLRRTAADLAEAERQFEAAQVLEVALREALVVDAPFLEADLVRALAKASWRVGRLERAAELYQRAATLSSQLGDRAAEVVAHQGLGNVIAAQGRWREAEERHCHALSLCTAEDTLLRGQLFNNLSQVSRRQDRLDDAWEWQRRAEETWAEVDAPADRVVAHNNAALLHLAEDSLDAARRRLMEGLGEATSELQRAALLVNLAQAELRSGDRGRAEQIAREAEEFGIVAGATDLLIEAYTILGVVFRERGDDHCVAFFEKALEMGRVGQHRLACAAVDLEYGRYRRRVGDHEEARARLERAAEVYEALGAARELAEVRGELG